MRKPLFIALAVAALLLGPNPKSTPADAAPENANELNIGVVVYTKSRTPGALTARWNYANHYSGPGIAIGEPNGGFGGEYHVRYFYEDGTFSDEYDLEIKKTGDFYDVTWISNGKVSAKGVGMEVENGNALAVGWRRVED